MEPIKYLISELIDYFIGVFKSPLQTKNKGEESIKIGEFIICCWIPSHGKHMMTEPELSEFVAISPTLAVFECVGYEDNFMVIRYKNKEYKINDRMPKQRIKPIIFKIGEEVWILGKTVKIGTIINISWHFKKNEHIYFLKIKNRNSSRRYFETELKKINQDNSNI